MSDDVPFVLGHATPGLLLFSTPDEWIDDVHRVGDSVVEAFRQAVDRAARELEGLDESRLLALGAVSPVLGALAAWQADRARDELRARLAAAAREVGAKLDELWVAVGEATDRLLGSPARLLELGGSYDAARAELDSAVFDARTEGEQLDRHWGGVGERAFRSAADSQVDAMTLYAGWLRQASYWVAEAAEAIKLAWSDVVHALVDLYTGLVRALAAAFDVGNVLSFEVGPVLQVVATCIDFLEAGAKPVRDLSSSAETTWQAQWSALESSDKLDAGAWPQVDAQDAHEYGTARTWQR